MESLHTKKAIFTSTEITLLKKKGNITISIDEIDFIGYSKPSFMSYLFKTNPGYLQIYLVGKKIFSKMYLVRIKYKDVLELPKAIQKKIYSRY